LASREDAIGSSRASQPAVSDVGEFGLIEQVAERLRGVDAEHVLVAPGDDAAVVAMPDGRCVVTTDMLVEGVHFRRDWSEAYDVGRKAAAANLADVAAMGARGSGLVVGLGMPPDLPVEWVLALADGLRDEAAGVGAVVVGGDMAKSPVVTVSVAAIGELDGREPVTRAGASEGDLVAVCGQLGRAAAGLALLRRGFRSPRALVDAHRRPQPPYAAGVTAAVSGATAMCDVSDGLLADLGHVATASGVAIVIDPHTLEVDAALADAAAALGADPMEFLLTGGEDHALAATFAPGSVPDGWLVVGQVAAGAGVTVLGRSDFGALGYDHFAG
jgi:thiamine-monophosphate kinase